MTTPQGFRLFKIRQGWRWETVGLDGEVAERGEAPTKALAAASIIHALTRPLLQLAA